MQKAIDWKVRLTGSTIALSFVLVATPSVAQDYFPLDAGLQWAYIQPAAPAADLFVSIDGPALFEGRSTTARTSTVSAFGESSSGTAYWSSSGTGELLLHGHAGTSSQGIVGADLYTPPRVILPTSLVQGATWGGDTQVDHYEDGVLVVSYTDPYTVEVGPLDEVVSVPGGEFTAARITVTYVNWQETYWFAPGVGMVKWVREWSQPASSTTYLLDSFDFSVPLVTDTVGRLKTSFGN